MFRIIPNFAIIVATMFLSIGCDRDQVKEFGPLKLGGPTPYKPGDSVAYHLRKIPQSKFYIYVAEKDLLPDCAFEDCGIHGGVVECLGGWLSGNSTDQPTHTEAFGLDKSEATSIIVVADQDSTIVGIYPNYTMQNLPEILKRHADLIDFGSFAVKCPRGDQTVCCGCGQDL
ncbi:hypothetical protein WDW89_03620 [Deltaproteobacteria bacterium TL4]